jgi:hypothetical protein
MGVTAGIFFNFTKRDALSSVYKISMDMTQLNLPMYIIDDELERCGVNNICRWLFKKNSLLLLNILLIIVRI